MFNYILGCALCVSRRLPSSQTWYNTVRRPHKRPTMWIRTSLPIWCTCADLSGEYCFALPQKTRIYFYCSGGTGESVENAAAEVFRMFLLRNIYQAPNAFHSCVQTERSCVRYHQRSVMRVCVLFGGGCSVCVVVPTENETRVQSVGNNSASGMEEGRRCGWPARMDCDESNGPRWTVVGQARACVPAMSNDSHLMLA